MPDTRDWFVECTDYVAGPYTEAGAHGLAANLAAHRDEGVQCPLDHTVTQTPTHPVGSTFRYEDQPDD